MAFAESRLEAACQALREDEELAPDARAFAASEIAASKHSRSPPSLRRLERLAALDTLRFALWGYARQRGQRLEHPTRLLEAVQRWAVQRPGVAAACRALLRGAPHVARSWGARRAWLDDGDESALGEARPFGAGCALLRLLRARWVEAVAAVAAARPPLDCAEPKVREALLAWQYAGRDCGARWLAFAV